MSRPGSGHGRPARGGHGQHRAGPGRGRRHGREPAGRPGPGVRRIALGLSGDPAGAEPQLRDGYRVLERLGESGMRSNLGRRPGPCPPARPARRGPRWPRPAGPSPPMRTCSPRSAGAAPRPAPWPGRARWRGRAAGRRGGRDRRADRHPEYAADALLDQAAVAAAAGRPGDARRRPGGPGTVPGQGQPPRRRPGRGRPHRRRRGASPRNGALPGTPAGSASPQPLAPLGW